MTPPSPQNPSIADEFVAAALFAVGFLIASALGSGTPSVIAWLPKLFSYLMLVVAAAFVVRGVAKIFGKGAMRMVRAASIQLPPETIYMIRPAPLAFSLDRIRETEEPLPDIEGEWLSMMRDHDALKAYAGRLDGNRNTARSVLTSAVGKFVDDRSKLVQQQTQIMRRAWRARALIKDIAGLPKQGLSLESLPQYASIAIPSAPAYLTQSQLAHKYPLVPGGAGAQIGHLLANPGGGNWIAAAVATAATVLYAKATLSKALRALELARGQANTFYADARGTIATLARAHEEIVASSERLKAAELEIGELTGVVAATARPGRVSIDTLDASAREKVIRLWQWVLCADAVHARAAV